MTGGVDLVAQGQMSSERVALALRPHPEAIGVGGLLR